MDRIESGCVYIEFSSQKMDGKEVKEAFLVTVFTIDGEKQRTRKSVSVNFSEEASGVCFTDCNQLIEILTDVSAELGKTGWDLIRYTTKNRPAIFHAVFHRKINGE